MSTPLAFQAQETTIGDCTYRVEPLGFVDGRKLFVRLLNILGPSMASMDSKVEDGTPGAQEAAVNAFWGGIGKLLTSVKDEDLVHLEALFKVRTTVVLPPNDQGQVLEPVLRDIMYPKDGPGHFAGDRFLDYFQWLAFCLKVTYGPFFSGAWTKMASVAALAPGGKAALPSIFRQTSTGGSGDSSQTKD
jgi:hypothetical protein